MDKLEKFLWNLNQFPTSYIEEIKQVILMRLPRIENGKRWLSRLTKIGANQNAKYKDVKAHLFELKVMNYLLSAQDCSSIQYEPVGKDRTGKNCDLLLRNDTHTVLMELKTFHPKAGKKEIPQYITKHNRLYMGEELYHEYDSVRTHLIEETLDAEKKFGNYHNGPLKVMGFLCDYYLDVEDLKDFVCLYKIEKIRLDDPLGDMSLHVIKKQKINFSRSINQFWAFPFEQYSFQIASGKRVHSF